MDLVTLGLAKKYTRQKILEASLGGEEVDLSGYAKKTELPTKVSQLANDSGFISKVPDDYATEEWVQEYVEEHSGQNAVLYTQQNLTTTQQEQARTNIGAISRAEVEELLGVAEKEFSVSGELVELDVDIDPGTELNVVSKIHRDENWGLANTLVLHQVSGDNFVDLSGYLGGAGKVYEKNGITVTINDDGTMTSRGTNESTGYSYPISQQFWSGVHSEKVYPAGTYTIPDGFLMSVRAAQHPANNAIAGVADNLTKTVTIPEPFRIVVLKYAVKAGATVDVTLPLGLFRGTSVPETGYEYSGNIYTATFDAPAYEGEYNWTTGELKDADGNTVVYYEPQTIKRLPGVNYFWTGFGENTVANVKNGGKIVLRLNEPAPEETVPSICDFTFTPTTPEAAYGLYFSPFLNGGEFFGNEVPVLTTKGTLYVKDADGNVKYSKYIPPMFNRRGVRDELTHKGLKKKWSGKFYLTKEPISITESPPPYSGPPQAYIFVWEFDESEFANTGIPAKIRDIPIASPCFINNDKSEDRVNTAVLYYGDPYPAFFSYNAETGKYTLTAKGIQGWSIKYQLTHYSKVHFYYQLETPYEPSFAFAMGIAAGDTIFFDADLVDNRPYIDALSGFKDHSVEPMIAAFVPLSVEDAMDGMTNAATILNNGESAVGDATVQGYSWIGEGDGTTDYTVQIQSKLDELNLVSKGGTVYLGPGTYPISGSLIVYDNTRIIGDGQTVIEQTADNTHALILSGSHITIKELTVKLSGACTALTACVYVNSENHPNIPDRYDSDLPINIYAHNITVENVLMLGTYSFDSVDGHSTISDDYENYKGVGIGSAQKLFFNYAHVDNVTAEHLMAGVYGTNGSCYFNITSEFCKYGLYIVDAGNNTYFVAGHPYYSQDENGNYISMSDAIAYVEYDNYSTYHLRTYDVQAYRTLIYLGSRTASNKIDIQYSLSNSSGLYSDHHWDILKWFVIDHGRGNIYNNYKQTPFHIGSGTYAISGDAQFELSNPVIQNAISGAGIWGNISSNTEFENKGIALRDICRYPSEKNVFSNHLPYIVSESAPSADNPIEIVIDCSNRPVIGVPNYFIQFYHGYVASDYEVFFDTTNTGVFNEEFVIHVTGNTNAVEYFNYPQIGDVYTTYRMKIRFTKPLQIPSVTSTITGVSFEYNPDGLIGICNIGMTVNDYAGRSFLGECGGSLYGNVDMHQNTLKNLPAPVDDGDAVNKAHLESELAALRAELAALRAVINGTQ